MSCFMFGVARYMETHYKGRLDNLCFAGVSAGALAATGLALGCDSKGLFEDTLKCYPHFPTRKDIREGAESINVGDDAWRRVSNRLYLGVTRIPGIVKENLSTFSNQQDGIMAIEASCQFPIFVGMAPLKIANKYYYDGAILHEYPYIPKGMEDYRKIYVNSKGPGDICPGIDIPFLWILCPPSVEVMWQLEHLGYLRAKEYFSSAHSRDGTEAA